MFQARDVVFEVGLLTPVFVMPGTALGRLQAILDTGLRGHGHDQGIFILQLFEQGGDILAQVSGTLAKIGNHKIGQGVGGRPYARVGYGVGRQFVDQEDEFEQISLELFAATAIGETLDVFVYLSRHDGGLQ